MLRALGVAVAVLVCGALGLKLYQAERARAAYEQRAVAAEDFARNQRVLVDLYRDRATATAAQAAQQDTIIVYRRAAVATVDAATPPPADCLPNLAARDSLIVALDRRVALGDSVATDRGRALLALQASHDTLQTVLAARPRLGKWHGPSVGVGVFVGLCAEGRPCGGVGVTVNLFGRRL